MRHMIAIILGGFGPPVSGDLIKVRNPISKHKTEVSGDKNGRIIIMDGSMGRYLSESGLPQDALFKTVWSARALVDTKWHSAVVAAHRAYIEAGADLLITNAYGVQPTFYKQAFGEEGGSGRQFLKEQSADLPNQSTATDMAWYDRMLQDAQLASRLAVQARAETGKDKSQVRIFGCLPPLAESHQPKMFFDLLEKEGSDFVREAFQQLASASLRGGADGLILENLVCLEEAELALAAVKEIGTDIPVILSMEGALRDRDRTPQPLIIAPDIARLALRAKFSYGVHLEALGFSCAEPEAIMESYHAIRESEDNLLEQLHAASIRLSVHANLNDRHEVHQQGFTVAGDDASKILKRHDLVDDSCGGYIRFCEKLVRDFGVSVVGGCCGCGPDGIRAIQRMSIRAANMEAVPARELLLSRSTQIPGQKTLRVALNLANTLLVRVSKEKKKDGGFQGIAPTLAHELAAFLDVPNVIFVPFKNPGEVATSANENLWDVAFVALDPTRISDMAFSDAYIQLPCTFLTTRALAEKMELRDARDVLLVRGEGSLKIASLRGAAYDLWLQRSGVMGSVFAAATFQESVDMLAQGQVHIVAGARSMLQEVVEKEQLHKHGDHNYVLLDSVFMSVPQCIAVPVRRHGSRLPEVVREVKRFVRESVLSSSLMHSLLKENSASTKNTSALLDIPRAPQAPIRVTILGCGAMGSIYGMLFASAGHHVTAVDPWAAHVEKISQNGLRLSGPLGDRTVLLSHALLLKEVEEGLGAAAEEVLHKQDLVIVATKAAHVRTALKTAAKQLLSPNPSSRILLIQNGIGFSKEQVSSLGVDPTRIMLGIASNFGARMVGPGHAEHKSMNLICIGELVPRKSDVQLMSIAQAWEGSGFSVQPSLDIRTQIWEKLVCNCAFSAVCTLTGFTVGQALDTPSSRSLALACAREAAAVGRAKGIHFKFDDAEEYVLKFGSTVRDAKPSMLQDHEAGRRSEIDVINGAIPGEATKVGVTAETNRVLAEVVRAREAGFLRAASVGTAAAAAETQNTLQNRQEQSVPAVLFAHSFSGVSTIAIVAVLVVFISNAVSFSIVCIWRSRAPLSIEEPLLNAYN